MEDDSCIMQIGPYRAHFTGYQPAARASQEFCEDIPVVGDAIIVLDFLDSALRDMDVAFQVVLNRTGRGVDAGWEDIAEGDAITAERYFAHPTAQYPNGSLNVELGFTNADDFIGVVQAHDPATGRDYVSVFPFSVGKSGGFAWGWIAAALGFGLLLYLMPTRRRRRSAAEEPAES